MSLDATAELTAAFERDLKASSRSVEQRGTVAVAGERPPERGASAYRPASRQRTATVRKTLRLDAGLVTRFEALETSPPLTRLVEAWLRDYLDGK